MGANYREKRRVSPGIADSPGSPLSGRSPLFLLHKSEASTNLVVQDGQTIIIGGLIREDTSRATSGIPWLHKIPLIGPLFGGITTGSSRQEILILLTPHVIKTIQEAKDITRTYVDTFTDQGRVKKEELMKGLSGREKIE